MGDNDFITSLPYTSDVHLNAGKARIDLAKHVEDNLLEMSQSEAQARGIDEEWEQKYQDALNPKKATPRTVANGTAKPGVADCKWCRLGQCWDHQGVSNT